MKAWFTVLFSLLLWVPSVQADPYDFPIVPGTPEWNELTLEERLKVHQLPDSLLYFMSTEDLYQTFLVLPGRLDYHLSSNISTQHAFDKWLLWRYNILPELLARYDIADVLYGHYLSFIIDESNSNDFEYQFYRIPLTTMLLFQYTIIAQLTPEERRELAAQAYAFRQLGNKHPDWWVDGAKACALLGRIMAVDGFLPLLQRAENDPDVQQCLDYANPSQVFMELAPDYLNHAVTVDDMTPKPFTLSPPCPNPFNASTTITYTLPTPSLVTLSVYNTAGQKVATLVDMQMFPGTHTALFDGSGFSSGLYFARITAGGKVGTQKMLLVK